MSQLYWQSAYESHEYHPAYLANGYFGGLIDLSGANLSLWSHSIIAAPRETVTERDTRYPVTALKTEALFRPPYWRQREFWISRGGIRSKDPGYTADPAMPHLPQVYQCRQSQDLDAGTVETEGVLFPGSLAALLADPSDERAIPFKAKLAFLKDSPQMGLELSAAEDTEIAFRPEVLLEESFILHNEGGGVHSLGNEVVCDFNFKQEILEAKSEDGAIEYWIQPQGGQPYRILAHAPGARKIEIDGHPALVGQGRLFVHLQILADNWEEAESIPEADTFFEEQARRWQHFWSGAKVELPAEESLWTERYRASLYQVAQSLGPGPSHPTGLSKPMLPYWYGCFHDTDTYYCRPLLETGRWPLARPHLDFRRETLGAAREIARAAGRSGAFYPWESDPLGNGACHDTPVNSAIIGVEAWNHFLYSGEPAAAETAREILAAIFDFLCDPIDFAAQPLRIQSGRLMTFSETMEAEDPTEVRLGLRAVAQCCLQAEAGDAALRSRAERILAELDLPLADAGYYAFGGSGEPAYLRCPSVLLGAFPLETVSADATLKKSFAHELARIVHLFAWLPHQASVVASRLGLREGPTSAAALLRHADSFYKHWHAYDEWENRRTPRAQYFVTAAGGFCSAIHAMLLSETGDAVWSVFPGIPQSWTDLAFEGLLTRNGWRISARMEGGKVVAHAAHPAHTQCAESLKLRVDGQIHTYRALFTAP